jgi:PAS domain S-box-containing protein
MARDLVAGRLGRAGALAALEHLPDVCYFVKDARGRFVFGNRAFLALMGLVRLEQLVGRCDADFSPPHLCDKYADDDRRVLRTGRPLVDQIELVRNRDGSFDWFSTTKLPVVDGAGRRRAVAGVTRALRKRDPVHERFLALAPAIELVLRDFGRSLPVEELAAAVSLSPSQFRRAFKRRFGLTPHRYLRQVRLNAACELLATTDRPVADVAAQTGFCDQSHLTNELVRHIGLPPRRYREAFRRDRPPDVGRPRPL